MKLLAPGFGWLPAFRVFGLWDFVGSEVWGLGFGVSG